MPLPVGAVETDVSLLLPRKVLSDKLEPYKLRSPTHLPSMEIMVGP